MAAAEGTGPAAPALSTAAAPLVPLAPTRRVAVQDQGACVSAAGRPAGEAGYPPAAEGAPEGSKLCAEIPALTTATAECNASLRRMEILIESLRRAHAKFDADMADMRAQIIRVRKQEAMMSEAINDIERKRLALRSPTDAHGPARILAMAGQFAVHLERRVCKWIWSGSTHAPSAGAPMKACTVSQLDAIFQHFDETGAPRGDAVLEAMRPKYGNDPAFAALLSDRSVRAGLCERWHQLVSACPMMAQDLSSLREMCGRPCCIPWGITAETLAGNAEAALRAACAAGAEEMEEPFADEREASWVMDELRRCIVFLRALSSAERILQQKAA